MAQMKNILDSPIEEINVPVMKPTPYVPRRRPPIYIRRNFNRFADWIMSHVPEPIKRKVNKRVEKLKREVEKIYSRYDRLTLYEREAPLRGFLRTYRIDGREGYDQNTFIQYIRPRVIRFLSEKNKPFQVQLILTCKFRKEVGEKVEYNYGYFYTHVEVIMEDTDLGHVYNTMIAMILEKISKFQNKGSGWQFDSVVSLDISVDPYRPLRGTSYFPLPKKLGAKRAIINIKNERDNACFMWAITSAVFPRKKDPQRLNKEMRANSEKLNWEGIDFPTPLNQISLFEKQNPYSINVYGWTGTSVYPLRISKHENQQCINLILLSNRNNHHYCWIKNMSALTASQYNKHKGKRFVCKYCCNSFQLEESLQEHEEYCSKQKAVGVRMPKKGTMLSFKNHHRKMRVPFVVYADFEAITVPILTCSQSDDKSYTKQYQKHTPCGYSYYIKCFDDEIFPPVLRRYTIEEKDVNVGEIFVKSLEKDIAGIYQKFKRAKGIRITKEERQGFQRATVCHICENPLNNDKVRDHCHLTGRYRGAAHSQCNLKFKLPKFYPVIFHNLSGYDTHMFIKDLAKVKGPWEVEGIEETRGGIDCIAKTEENYVSFRKTIAVDVYDKDGERKVVKRHIRFLDSFKFMASSLSKLAGNLTKHPDLQRYFEGRQLELVKRKGVYPYDYMDCFERLNETCLPPMKDFYSRLNDEDISTQDYTHAQQVWDEFQMKTMKDYHDLYLMTDVLLLAEVFEEFRNVCLKHYKLDPAWYYTTPGLAWDACLKESKVKLELLHDQDMLLMVEKGIRGGVSMISTRYGKANNKYMEEYDSSSPSKYIAYLDANNLYGWAMSKKLPTHGFKWMTPTQLANWRYHTCILEVDLEYPHDLHDLHNDYPLAPDHVTINGVEKLIPNFNNKERYVVHYETLRLYRRHGLRVAKVHRGIVFHEEEWMKSYIDKNTKLRMHTKNNFEKDYFKLMNNSVFGKTIEDLRKRTDVKLVTTQEQAEKYINMPNYKGRTTFSDNLVAIHMGKTSLYMNKPVYLGMSILDLSKTLMYDFFYGYIKPKYGDKAELLFTDTDSLMCEIETEDFYKDVSPDVETWFDTSDYPKGHPSGIKTGVNKKVIGMFKDEAGGKIITKFVGLRAKNYAFVCDDTEDKKCKGIKKCVTKNNITFEDYETCLFTNVDQLRKMNVFRSHLHDVYTEEVNKIALSANDDKRVILKDGIHTLAHFHFRIFLGGSSVSSGTTNNSSLTNPLLGAPSDK